MAGQFGNGVRAAPEGDADATRDSGQRHRQRRRGNVTKQNGTVYGYRAAISIKSLFPGYADLRAGFSNQLDSVIADNTRMLLNALTPPDTVPSVTAADLRDVSDAKEEALRQWDARLSIIFD